MDVKSQNRHYIYDTALTLDRGTPRLISVAIERYSYIRDHPEMAESTSGCASTIRCCQAQMMPWSQEGVLHAAHPKLRPIRPIGHDLCCRDVAPVPVPALPHIHMEVHAAHQVPLVLQQPHLRGREHAASIIDKSHNWVS